MSYSVTNKGELCADHNLSPVTDEYECNEAFERLKDKYRNVKKSPRKVDWDDTPAGCTMFHNTTISGTKKYYYYWNQHSGSQHQSYFQICKTSGCQFQHSSERSQYTLCESCNDNGSTFTCNNPTVNYGTTTGGHPVANGRIYGRFKDMLDNFWCTEIGQGDQGYVSSNHGYTTGVLSWCKNYDSTNWHWCDWSDGRWKDASLDKNGNFDVITLLTCQKRDADKLPNVYFSGFCRFGSGEYKFEFFRTDTASAVECYEQCRLKGDCVAFAYVEDQKTDCYLYRGGTYTYGTDSKDATCYIMPGVQCKEDTNYGLKDEDGDGCDYYERNPSECGLHDGGSGFKSLTMCCACGGGSGEFVTLSMTHNCAHVEGGRLTQCSKQDFNCQDTCKGLDWCLGYSQQINGPWCLLYPNTDSCPNGWRKYSGPSTAPFTVATSSSQLTSDTTDSVRGYNCFAKRGCDNKKSDEVCEYVMKNLLDGDCANENVENLGCMKEWMEVYCKKSCGYCTST